MAASKFEPVVVKFPEDRTRDYKKSALEKLDAIREMVVSGDVCTVAIVATDIEGKGYHSTSLMAHRTALIGNLHRMIWRINQQIEEDDE